MDEARKEHNKTTGQVDIQLRTLDLVANQELTQDMVSRVGETI